MSWSNQLHSLSLKTKIVITIVGAGCAVFGASTYLSFTYWQKEARAVAEQQALLAAASARFAIENALNRNDKQSAQRALGKLVGSSAVAGARVYDSANRIVLSNNPRDIATRRARVWIPSARDLPRGGAARVFDEDGRHAVHAFIPIGSRLEHVLEVEMSMTVVELAMQRGSRLGIGLLVVSLLIVAIILYAMVQRELVIPFRAAERLAEERRVLLEERAGFAEVGELAAEMAHEFKRPLASIRTAVRLIEQEYTHAAHEQMLLGGIEAQLQRLSDTMADVFGLAKPVGIDAQPLDLAQVLDNALMQVSSAASNAQVKIQRHYASPIVVPGDARRLELAFANLFMNAVEAMPSGGMLTVKASERDGVVEVEVSDTGIGIEATHLTDVLRPFYSTKTTGTGLGLPLVARIVRSHGGDLQIESAIGKGTSVRLQFAAGEQREEKVWEARAS